MSVTEQEVLKANFVMVGASLLNSQNEIDAFRAVVDAEVLAELPGLPGLAVDSPLQDFPKRLTLNRDRITLDLSPARSVIEREYPQEEDLDRLAKVAESALSSTASRATPQSFGFNVDIVYGTDSSQPASRYIAERLPAGDLAIDEDWHLEGGSIKLAFRGDETLWTIRLEPRFQELDTPKLFLSLNLHREEQRTPSQDEIAERLRAVWKTAQRIMARFDEVGS